MAEAKKPAKKAPTKKATKAAELISETAVVETNADDFRATSDSLPAMGAPQDLNTPKPALTKAAKHSPKAWAEKEAHGSDQGAHDLGRTLRQMNDGPDDSRRPPLSVTTSRPPKGSRRRCGSSRSAAPRPTAST